jgi:hypothetical protein
VLGDLQAEAAETSHAQNRPDYAIENGVDHGEGQFNVAEVARAEVQVLPAGTARFAPFGHGACNNNALLKKQLGDKIMWKKIISKLH